LTPQDIISMNNKMKINQEYGFNLRETTMNTIFESSHPLVSHKLTRLRDKNTDPKKFRELIREVSALLAYEATADLEIAPKTVETPLAEAAGMEGWN